MAFGPLGRAWQQRIKWGGTYDKKWLNEKYPFLPDDFDDRYFQAAPEDQQIAYPKGGERVELLNLTPAGNTSFRLPALTVPVEFFLRSGETKEAVGVIDTIVLEPDLKRFQLSWRCSIPIRRNMRELRMILAGSQPLSWYREHGLMPEIDKPHYGSLANLSEAKRQMVGK